MNKHLWTERRINNDRCRCIQNLSHQIRFTPLKWTIIGTRESNKITSKPTNWRTMKFDNLTKCAGEFTLWCFYTLNANVRLWKSSPFGRHFLSYIKHSHQIKQLHVTNLLLPYLKNGKESQTKYLFEWKFELKLHSISCEGDKIKMGKKLTFDIVMVVMLTLSDWSATVRFMWEHLPTENRWHSK